MINHSNTKHFRSEVNTLWKARPTQELMGELNPPKMNTNFKKRGSAPWAPLEVTPAYKPVPSNNIVHTYFLDMRETATPKQNIGPFWIYLNWFHIMLFKWYNYLSIIYWCIELCGVPIIIPYIISYIQCMSMGLDIAHVCERNKERFMEGNAKIHNS